MDKKYLSDVKVLNRKFTTEVNLNELKRSINSTNRDRTFGSIASRNGASWTACGGVRLDSRIVE